MLAASPMRASDVVSTSTVNPVVLKQAVVRVDRRTGKLVSTVTGPTGAKVNTPNPRRSTYTPMIEQAAKAHDVDPLLVDSIIQVESAYNPYAVSRAGAEGLMQLMPGTARMLGVSNSFDPQQNIEAGVRYLKQLQEQYKDPRLALAAYNAGPKSVEKYKWVPPFQETQRYVTEVGRRYDDARKAAEQAVAALPGVPQIKPDATPANQPAEVVPAEKHPRLEQFVDEQGRLHLRTSQAQ